MSVQTASIGDGRDPLRLIAATLRGLLITALSIMLALPVVAASLEQQLREIEAAIPGNSYTKYSPTLAVQSWEMAATIAHIQKPASCQTAKLVGTKVTAVEQEVIFTSKRKLKQGSWSEIWTFDKCGQKVQVKAHFDADGRGTADGEFSVVK